jgi:protein-S-isoprenylcysteine O-methyltransferase Ste14
VNTGRENQVSTDTEKKNEQEEPTRDNDNPGVITLPPFIFIAFLGVGVILHNIFPLHFIQGPIRNIVGAIFLAYSVLVASLAIFQMRRAGTNIDVRKPSTTIVSNGIYRYTRNPMYLSMALLLIAVSVLISNIWILILTPVFIIVIQKGVIEREERYLEGKFGTEYTSYKKSTRRWI